MLKASKLSIAMWWASRKDSCTIRETITRHDHHDSRGKVFPRKDSRLLLLPKLIAALQAFDTFRNGPEMELWNATCFWNTQNPLESARLVHPVATCRGSESSCIW